MKVIKMIPPYVPYIMAGTLCIECPKDYYRSLTYFFKGVEAARRCHFMTGSIPFCFLILPVFII